MTSRDGRQMATGIAAFIVTALLILASAPAPQGSDALRLDRAATAEARPLSSGQG